MQKIAQDTFLIQKRGKYCPYCGKLTVKRETTTCPNCKGNWHRAGGRCENCQAAIDPGWSYCELCGVETARARRLKRAKQLSHRAKLRKIAHSELPPPPPPPPKSPDLFGPDLSSEELDSIEATFTSCDQQSEKTRATELTNVSDDMSTDDVVADTRDSS